MRQQVGVSEQFAVIANLSDEIRAMSRRSGHSLPVYGGTPTEQALRRELAALSDQSLKELRGLAHFGKEYKPWHGDPAEVLSQYIKDAIIFPRKAMESCLEEMPIGEYLRHAIQHLSMTTSADIERA